MRIREVECRTVLNRSGITDYCVNCYAGCQHGCIYCYARFATRFTHPGERWGSFLDVKANAVLVLEKEVTRKKPGRVFVSSVCDAWQPQEARHLLTRRSVELLLRHGFTVYSLTKNKLAARDLDIMRPSRLVDFGVTVTTLNSKLARLIEPIASLPGERIALLYEARSRGLPTHAFLGPLMPYLSDTEEDFAALLKAALDTGVDYVYVDRLNRRFGVWPAVKALLEAHNPECLTAYRSIFFDERARADYEDRLRAMIVGVVRRFKAESRLKLCF